jgi:nitrous oxide reductase accessory protein NosL
MADWRELCKTTILSILAMVLLFAGCGAGTASTQGNAAPTPPAPIPISVAVAPPFATMQVSQMQSFNLALGLGNER